jgi:hypothetical protein
VELSHGSGTCLSQESKDSGTLGGSKAETNDAASTSTNACSELLNKTQHKQKTPFSDSEYLNH